MIKRLTSLQNETVKKAASLQQKKYRLREGLFRRRRGPCCTGSPVVFVDRDGLLFTDLPEDFQKEAQGSDIPYYEVTGDIMKN